MMVMLGWEVWLGVGYGVMGRGVYGGCRMVA
jgi:hypothetical protein